ncbi:MAG: GNAT family N-acetyltransferase [Enhygromyxa sp.]
MPYPADPELRQATLELLGRTWTKLPSAITRGEAWGANWCELSTPFVELAGGRVVAHVGVIELPLVLDGQRRRFAGIHAVCTELSQRGRGHMRAAMTRALAHVDAHFDGALLWANDPTIYGRFGFVAREESMFVGPVRGGTSERVRPLSLAEADDLALLHRYLDRRTPASLCSEVTDATALTLIDLALWQPGPSLALVPELDCIVVYAVRERFLELYDVIAEQPVALGELASRLGAQIDTAIVHFTPDRLDAPQLRAEPTVLIDTLMVRGEWIAGPLAIAPVRRC